MGKGNAMPDLILKSMNKKEFRNYAVKHHRINSLYVDHYISRTSASLEIQPL